MMPAHSKNIWIDLDNSPHVPFFIPIIEALERRGCHIILTARNTYQVCDLLHLHGLSSKVKVVGHHWGKNRILKIMGTCLRTLKLLPVIAKQRPDLAVSHGSRAQVLSAYMARIPSVLIYDYEFTSSTGKIQPDWYFTPDLIPASVTAHEESKVMRYPGLKEDVYISRLKPDPSIKAQLGLSDHDIVVTVRPPATEAHYHNPESEALLEGVLDLLIQRPDVRVILAPRNAKQEHVLRLQWNKWIESRKIIIPDHVVDGLNLIWFSDLVVSGGGTMNREAAALGVPVYSIFRGPIGAVDQYLADKGRLTLLKNLEDVRAKIVIERSSHHQRGPVRQSAALDCIVNAIISIAEHQCLPTSR